MPSPNEPTSANLRTRNDELEERIAARITELRQQELVFNQLVSGIADYAIFMLDLEGHVLTWNRGAERIKGYRPEEIIGKHFSVFYTLEDRAAGIPQRALGIAREHGKFEAESWRLRKDGTRFYANVVLDALHDDSGVLVGFAKITRDMTERRAIEEQLAQAQKMEAIGLLTGGVAHDFNNILTVVLGNLEVIARASDDPDRRKRAIDLAMRGAQRAATLTQQLLAFSRRQPLNPKPTDVNKMVASASELLRSLLGETISVETVLSGGLWITEIDPHQLESAIVNLALNGRDAMVSGGKLTIETANAHLDEMYRKQGNLDVEIGQYVLVCVTDTGTGITKDVLAHVFEPFFTTKPTGEGTGLGLSQVYGFVKQSGGHVKIYTEPGQGTTVKLYLPRFMSGNAVETDEVSADHVPVGHETILLVEDDEDVRAFGSETLRDLGFDVIQAQDGKTALALLARNPKIELLFTDVGLPGVNGRQLAEQARQHRPDLRVLFTTGYARNAIVHQGRLDEGVELLPKPYTRERLAIRIREVLDAPLRTNRRSRVALVVVADAPQREVIAYFLKALDFRVVEANSASQARSAGVTEFEVAVIEASIGHDDVAELVHELRETSPGLRVLFAAASARAPDIRLGSAESNVPTAFIAEPYTLQGVTTALKELGISPFFGIPST